MAYGGGYAALFKAKQKSKDIDKKTALGMELISAAGTAASFAVGKAKGADTAWGEYEAGHKELGGTEPIERPKFGDEGYFKSIFKGPEGEVSIGEGKTRRTYDIENVRQAGEFLGSDAAAILSDEQRAKYLGRTAPGRVDPLTGKVPPLTKDFGQGKVKLTSSGYTTGKDSSVEGGESYRAGFTGGGSGRIGVQAPDYKYQPTQPQETVWSKFKGGIEERFKEHGFGMGVLKMTHPASYAKGGDFITNGPQKIIVGDNPGGRERVTIRPLSSKEVDFYNKNPRRSLWDSKIKNNENRKY